MPRNTQRTKRYNAALYASRVRMGLCRNCGRRKPRSGHVSCRPCGKRMAAHYAARKERILAQQRDYVAKVRAEVIKAYGGKCACCGEKRPEFLTIDHVNGDGAAHRKKLGHAGHVICLFARRNGYPKTLRVLCMNCNFSYGVRGYCPHQKGARDVKRRRNVQVRR